MISADGQMYEGEAQITQGYALAGTVLYGENGDPWGSPELALSTPQVVAADWVQWDGDPFDGIDSGWRDFSFVAKAGDDGLEMSVGSADVSSGVDALEGISQINIINIAAPEMGMIWSTVQVSFYRDGQLVESANLDFLNIGVDQTIETDGMIQQQTVRVATNTSGVDEVRLTAQIRLHTNEGAWPAPTDMFSQIQIYT